MGEGDFGVVEIGRARCGAGTVDPAGSLRWMGPSRRIFKRTNRERDIAIPHWWVGSGGGDRFVTFPRLLVCVEGVTL